METALVFMLCLLSLALADETYQDSSHICDKCTCSDQEDKFVLDCSDQGFQHVLANWPAHNKTLIATFSHNNFTNLERLPITQQKAMLVLDHCNIQYVDIGVFSLMEKVEFIDLSYNLLTTVEIDGQDFKGPYNNSKYYPIALKYLNLAYNEIHSLPRKFFENMPLLEELNLEGNDFTVLDPNTQLAISTLRNLKVLNLANNELTEVEEYALNTLENLQEIDLSSNHLEFVPMTLNYVSKTLKILNMSNNHVFELDDKSFSGLDLMELYLDNLPRLEYIKSNTFAILPNLKQLSLCNNKNLKGIDRQAFDENQKLDKLYLNNNSLTAVKFQLLNWSTLKIFQMEDNPLECTCDLYNISKTLRPSITRNEDGPECVDLVDGTSRSVYSLTEEICGLEHQPFHISHVVRHFQLVRSIVITLSLILTIGFLVAMVVGFLRYRRGIAFRNYPFAAQVSYYPVAATAGVRIQ